MSDRETKSVTASIITGDISRQDDMAFNLLDVFEQIKAAMASIPPEYLPSATLRFTAYGDSVSYVPPEVVYERPETDDEVAQRMAQKRRWEMDDERREREELRRLQRKYGA